MDKKMHDKGLEVRKAVLGEAYVNNALKSVDDFNRPFQEMLNEYCWGTVWGREELPRKTRSMLNIAMIAILNRQHEFRAHLKGALTNGVSRERDPRDSDAGRNLWRHAGGGRQFSHRARGVRGDRREGVS
ncbi:4-carboxymuconolactone decarboxylase [Bradyrhizobium sp. LM3.6]